MSGAVVAATSGGSSPVVSWPPPPRGPLPPKPDIAANQPGPPQASCWTDGPFDDTLPFTPPDTPTLDFHRGNFCGVRVPGYPMAPSSQGWLDCVGGIPVPTDPNRIQVVGGHTFVLPMTRAPWTVGQSLGKPFKMVAWNAATQTYWLVRDVPSQFAPSVAVIGAEARFAISFEPDVPIVTQNDLVPLTEEPAVDVPTFAPFPHDVSVGAYFADPDCPGDVCIIPNAEDYRTAPANVRLILEAPSFGTAEPPRDRLAGVYSETRKGLSLDVARARGVPLFACQDGPDPYDGAVLAALRPEDWPLLECYPKAGETVEQAIGRYLDNARRLLTAWPGRIGIVWLAYRQGTRLTVAQVLAFAPGLPQLISLSKRVALVDPFAWRRPDACSGPSWTDPANRRDADAVPGARAVRPQHRRRLERARDRRYSTSAARPDTAAEETSINANKRVFKETIMPYLSYSKDKLNAHGAPIATPSDVIDVHSLFQPDGNVYSLEGIAIGINVMVFGALAPGGKLCFFRYPMFSTRDDGQPWDTGGPGDFGEIVPQQNGTVAIKWPL